MKNGIDINMEIKNDFKKQFDGYINLFEESIDKYLSGNKYGECDNINNAMLYSLRAGGKRIRPMLVLGFYDALYSSGNQTGGSRDDALGMAMAVEMLHTYSLIHDDLPCMDDDDYRRGKLTNHKVYGEAVSTLAGDALLTKAFEVISNLECDPVIIIAAMRELSSDAGCEGMIGGQIIDIESEGRQIDRDTLILLHSLKTSKLIESACVMGAVCAGGSKNEIHAAREFGYNLGLAFQITDDILDVSGDFDKLGKNTGSDSGNGKCTSVTLLGMDSAVKSAENYSNNAKAALSAVKNNTFLMNLCDLLLNREN